jgi:hypothetical protein
MDILAADHAAVWREESPASEAAPGTEEMRRDKAAYLRLLVYRRSIHAGC